MMEYFKVIELSISYINNNTAFLVEHTKQYIFRRKLLLPALIEEWELKLLSLQLLTSIFTLHFLLNNTAKINRRMRIRVVVESNV